MDRIIFVLTKWSDHALLKIPDLLAASAILLVFLCVAWFARRFVDSMLRRAEVDPNAATTLSRLAYYPILIIGVLLALSELDVNFAALGLEMSLVGVGIGFALRDILTNFAAGVLLMASRPFAQGDQIRIKEFEGTVESVGWRGTALRTYDGRRIIIPNQDVFSNAVTNNTAYPVRRSSIFVSIGVNTDLRQAAQTALVALNDVPEVAQEPLPEVLVKELGDFAIKLEIRIWSPALQSEMLRINSEATRVVKEAFDSHGIEMPFPTHVVLMKNSAA